MDVDALSKGSGKGKKGKSKSKKQRQRQDEQCRKQQLVRKQVRKVTNMLMNGLGVVNKLLGAGKRPIGRQDFRQHLVQDHIKRSDTLVNRRTSRWI